MPRDHESMKWRRADSGAGPQMRARPTVKTAREVESAANDDSMAQDEYLHGNKRHFVCARMLQKRRQPHVRVVVARRRLDANDIAISHYQLSTS